MKLYITIFLECLAESRRIFCLLQDTFIDTEGKIEENLECFTIFTQEASQEQHRTRYQRGSRTKSESFIKNINAKVHGSRYLSTNFRRNQERTQRSYSDGFSFLLMHNENKSVSFRAIIICYKKCFKMIIRKE